jgi:hypothetical protein
MQPTLDGGTDSVADTARRDSGLATVYRALDVLVTRYELRDAAVVADIPGLGRQVLHAGRRPLHNDERRLHDAAPGLYLDPPVDDPVLADVMLAVTALGLRLDLGPHVQGEARAEIAT